MHAPGPRALDQDPETRLIPVYGPGARGCAPGPSSSAHPPCGDYVTAGFQTRPSDGAGSRSRDPDESQHERTMNMHVVGGQGPTKRLVVVADNSLIVEAIAIGLRKSGAFKLLGHVNARTGPIEAIAEAAPDVVLVDDLEGSDESIDLVARIKAEHEQVAVIVLSTSMDPDWLDAIFAAGAAGAISKATHPAALATLVRETIDGHVVHVYKSNGAARVSRPATVAAEQSPLTSRELEVLQLVAAGATNG